jgi:hypothetical protein
MSVAILPGRVNTALQGERRKEEGGRRKEEVMAVAGEVNS